MEGGEMTDRDQSQRKTKQTKKIRVTTTAKNYLSSMWGRMHSKTVFSILQSSVFCTLSVIWYHKECADMSDAVFKIL
jgi:hypothetical protein